MPRLRQVDPAALTLRLQIEGPLTAQALANTSGVHRSNVSRALATLGDRLVRLGVTRGMRYALPREVRMAGNRFPLYRVDANGQAHEWGELTAMHPRVWRLIWTDHSQAPGWANLIHDHAGVCEGFPFFLGDVRPQGYLGRALARGFSSALRLPADPRDWSDDDTLVYLQAQGEDLPGNVVVGDVPMRRVTERRLIEPETTAEATRAARYVELATLAAAGEAPGSSVEGEQPKFTAVLAGDTRRSTTHVIVKFTDFLTTPTGRRWADLLAAEAQAHAVLQSAGESVSTVRLLDAGGRRFFEIERFDRTGAHGRTGVVSLRSLYDALPDAADATTWLGAAQELARLGVIDEAAERAIRLRHTFGGLIGNTDMHFGNLAFYLENTRPLRLAPVFDMLPMLWAPRPGQAMPVPPFSPASPLPGERALWAEAAAWAADFWARAASDTMVSAEFAGIARRAGAQVERMRGVFG